MNPSADVVVVGGGVVGCSVAYHAARRGARVVLLEAETVGSGASGAAAGMLAAQAEARGPDSFLDLLLESRKMHRKLGAELYEVTGLDAEYVWEGTLRVALSEAHAEDLSEALRWQREAGLSARWLDGAEVRELEPALSAGISGALYLPEDGQVNSPRLVRALALAAARNRAEVSEGEPASGLIRQRNRIAGVRTARRKIAAGSVVVCGGVASGTLARHLGIRLPVAPVKGQILSVETTTPPITSNVWDEECYLVPKRDGRVIVGATEEPGTHDRRPTLGGVAGLAGAAIGLLPHLARRPFAGAWGGLRPGTPDGRPLIGPAGDPEGLLIATGHYRNGVLLAPITGDAVSALALGEQPAVDLSPFSPLRFEGQR
ncbi:glycine oxidase ThiO [Rubrobacter naiadicus]|uniref:glycine oxidase ThiO n=1 Tax=Rubrobacter naiadicus TaxID=1392641 RepID=UPI0023622902|nr:glycine oxidase ThiO [Rubrobacter naiadicus]